MEAQPKVHDAWWSTLRSHPPSGMQFADTPPPDGREHPFVAGRQSLPDDFITSLLIAVLQDQRLLGSMQIERSYDSCQS